MVSGAATEPAWWDHSVDDALNRAGGNRPEIERTLAEIPAAHRAGLSFVLTNMPAVDLRKLSSRFVLDNVNQAYAAWESAPWHGDISTSLFLNEILPYVNITESREAWRAKLREISLPLIAGCQTPGEAAQRLNEKLFPLVQVKYSTKRKRADQSPSESMATGLASCTGLSILLVDACRSVGVPARLAGVPNWSDDRGNHTWVEVWDGRWHFTGAAEPDQNGLDHAWFEHDASLAVRDSREHAIYAVSFARTDTPFPAGWADKHDYVSAENVTDRYASPKKSVVAGETRLMVKVMDLLGGRRVIVPVEILNPDTGAAVAAGRSRDDRSDANDYLSFNLKSGQKYLLRVMLGNQQVEREITLGTSPVDTATVYLASPESSVLPGCVNPGLKTGSTLPSLDSKP